MQKKNTPSWWVLSKWQNPKGAKKSKKKFLLETLGEKNCYRFFEIGVYLGSDFEPMRLLQNDQMLMENDQIHHLFSENYSVSNPVISEVGGITCYK